MKNNKIKFILDGCDISFIKTLNKILDMNNESEKENR